MVLAGKKVAECLERLGLGAVRQFVRPPGLANQARGAVTIAFGQQAAREREPALGAGRLTSDEAANRRGVASLLPQPHFRPPAEQRRARPVRVIGNEGREAIKTRFPRRGGAG